ncbi:MAG: hypothetical protein ACLUNO_12270 [Oscillospiraceae bacterium]
MVLLFVCAAIYFNWSYNTQWGKADAEMAAAEDAATAAVKAEEDAAAASASASDDYFAQGAPDAPAVARRGAVAAPVGVDEPRALHKATIDSAMSATLSAMRAIPMPRRRSEISYWPRIFRVRGLYHG